MTTWPTRSLQRSRHAKRSRRTEVNKARTSRTRTAVRQVEEAIASRQQGCCCQGLKIGRSACSRATRRRACCTRRRRAAKFRASARVSKRCRIEQRAALLALQRSGAVCSQQRHRTSPPSPHESRKQTLSDGFRDAPAARLVALRPIFARDGRVGPKRKMTFWRRTRGQVSLVAGTCARPLEIMNLLSRLSTGAVSNSQVFHCLSTQRQRTAATDLGGACYACLRHALRATVLMVAALGYCPAYQRRSPPGFVQYLVPGPIVASVCILRMLSGRIARQVEALFC